MTLEYGCDIALHRRFRSGAPNVELSGNSFPTCGRWAGILDHPSLLINRIWNGWGPAVFRWTGTRTTRCNVHGRGDHVIPPNIWQDNLLTGSTPYVVYPARQRSAKRGDFLGSKSPGRVAKVYNTAGVNVLASGNPKTSRRTR